MIEKLLPVGVLLLFFIVSCQQSAPEKDQQLDKLVKQLNDHTHPLESPVPTSSLSDLAPLSEAGHSKIVALGEATHGTKEFFQLKHKIFRYLAEQHNFRIFAFEADMGEAIYLNNYVQGRSGDIAQIMADKMHFWTWKTKEVEALLTWMRSFNKGKPLSQRVHIIGLNTNYMSYQPTLIEGYIKAARPELTVETQSVLKNIKKLTAGSRSQTRNSYQEMTENQRKAISDTLDYLMRKMEAVKEEMILASSDFKYQTMYRLVRNLQQVHQNLYARQKRNDRSLRDKYMAENAIWASQLFGEKTKIAVWAHNGHISESKSLLTLIPPIPIMGYHLDKKMGDDYTSIGFSFNKGTFRAKGVDFVRNKRTGLEFHAIESSPTQGSINHLFSLGQDDNFIFNIDALEPNSALNNWLSKVHGLLQIGGVYAGNPTIYYRPTILPKSYDFIIHLDSTSHSTSVQ
ncbi:erythromycin esterase family protein [Fodinibius salsisoli]|uniref:Erythromycin esterase family protein n=1 Tax=Fodinibius salsisoli TaxID=2820877 RepID=A0ABT3PNE5_9BACT|nr:erythromycin esterase family protein [Fodinibius salsisoli]MCW9707034.1 erythromycin esterase family protein [Fodinibius salsisoli]